MDRRRDPRRHLNVVFPPGRSPRPENVSDGHATAEPAPRPASPFAPSAALADMGAADEVAAARVRRSAAQPRVHDGVSHLPHHPDPGHQGVPRGSSSPSRQDFLEPVSGPTGADRAVDEWESEQGRALLAEVRSRCTRWAAGIDRHCGQPAGTTDPDHVLAVAWLVLERRGKQVARAANP
jgi:hypothetical protein